MDIGTYPDGKAHLTLAVVGEQIVTMFGQMVNMPIWDIKRGYSVRPKSKEKKSEEKPASSASAAVDESTDESASESSLGGMAFADIKKHLLGYGVDNPPKEKKAAATLLVKKIEQQPPAIYDFACANTKSGSARGSAGLWPGANAQTTEPLNEAGQDVLASKLDEVRQASPQLAHVPELSVTLTCAHSLVLSGHL